jgi:hypothetical protein
MRILLVTPLYPPDIAELAPYTKELATRLSATHTVEILTYGHIPEAIPGVTITSVEKSSILPLRLLRFFLALYRRARGVDVVYTQNGPSVELPVLLLSYISKTPLYLRIGDRTAVKNSETHFLFKRLLARTASRARAVVIHNANAQYGVPVQYIPQPDTRPEILPFSPYPKEAFAHFEDSWKTHVTHLNTLFSL